MRVTPLDIIQKQFAPARRGGVEADEVREFLEQHPIEEPARDGARS